MPASAVLMLPMQPLLLQAPSITLHSLVPPTQAGTSPHCILAAQQRLPQAEHQAEPKSQTLENSPSQHSGAALRRCGSLRLSR